MHLSIDTQKATGRNGVNNSAKSISAFLVILFALNVIIFSVNIELFFFNMRIWARPIIPLLLGMGLLGWFLRSKNLCKIGVWGAWLFIIFLIGTIVPDEDFYIGNDWVLPSKTLVVARLIILTCYSLLLLATFRKAQSLVNSYLKERDGGQDKN